MKPGVRAVGVAESFTGHQSTVAAAVTRASRVVDGFAFGTVTVGGTDATDRIVDIVSSLDREDVQYLLIAGIAPAWYNIVDLHTVNDRTGLPTISVTFEASEGLEAALEAEFAGDGLADRLTTYRAQPGRTRHTVNGHDLYLRAVGLEKDEADRVVRTFTPEGGRPEPLRVARLAARAADRWQHV